MSNQKNYDSEFCGRVPLHQTNMIQPHGVLMIVRRDDLSIIQVSENVDTLTGTPAPEVVEKKLTDYLPPRQIAQIEERFKSKIEGKLPFTFSFTHNGNTKDYLALVQVQQDFFIVEIEKAEVNETDNSFIAVYQELKFVIAAIEAAATIEEAGNIAIAELKRISGFDRIMVYCFDADWNGTVIAEVKEEGMDSYMGLKFPASDIPKQARELYRKNAYRLIPNAEYKPVRLYPVLNPVTHAFTNLSDANLRSVAGVHVEYLRNMKVVASMSTRIKKDDALWGLIACHHRTPKYLSYQICALYELLSNIISAKITSLENHSVHSFKSSMHQLYSKMVEHIYKSNDLVQGLYEQKEQLLELLKADGIAVVMNKQVHTFGTTPDNAAVEDLVFWLQSNGVSKTYEETSLSTAYDNAESYTSVASGLLALPIQPDRGNFILAFRPEAVQKVSWSGNPNEAINFEPDGKKYHPRASFRLWQETVKNNAVPWKNEELEIAENFRNFVVGYTLNKLN